MEISRFPATSQDRNNAKARNLSTLRIGQNVLIQDTQSKRWSKVEVVVGIGKHRDFHIKLQSGRVWWRNRRYLRSHYSDILIPAASQTTGGHEVSNHSQRAATPSIQPTLDNHRRSTRIRIPRQPHDVWAALMKCLALCSVHRCVCVCVCVCMCVCLCVYVCVGGGGGVYVPGCVIVTIMKPIHQSINFHSSPQFLVYFFVSLPCPKGEL